MRPSHILGVSYAHLSRVRLVVFDLDGTLTPSKTSLGASMAASLRNLLAVKKVAVIGGGSWPQFERQFVRPLMKTLPHEQACRLFLFPTTSTEFYRYEHRAWKEIYRKVLSGREKKKIQKAIALALRAIAYVPPQKTWGSVVEDRDTQITFSALGQKASLAAKKAWHTHHDVRSAFRRVLQRELPDFEVRIAGLTSVDVTRKGIDKAYGVREIEKVLRIPIKDMVFIGDELRKGGNDAAAKKSGVHTISTRGPRETQRIIRAILEASPTLH